MSATLKGLNERQVLFAKEYLKDLNATRAALAAGYSEKTAYSQAGQLLKKLEIKKYIEENMQKRADKLELSSDRVLQEISHMAFYDPASIASAKDADGDFVVSCAADIARLPEDVRRAIVGWGYNKDGKFTLKLADKSKALDQLARHLSLYNDKVEVKGLGELAERLERAAKRLK